MKPSNHFCLTGMLAGLFLVTQFAAAQPCVPAPSDATAWWRAQGNAQDFVGGHHGTLQGAAGFAAGKVGQAFAFDGADGSYVSVPDSAAWDFGLNDFTIELWTRFNDPLKRSMFIHQQSDAGAGGFEFDYQALGAGLVFARDPQHGLSRPWSPLADTWYHLAVTRQGSTFQLYVNGQPFGAPEVDANPVNNVTGILRLGSYAGQTGYGHDGLIDEPTIYARALSAAELQGIYNAGSAGKCQTTNCMRINVNVPACPSSNSVHISGNVSGCSTVTNLVWIQNGTSHVICEGCGVGPNFEFDLPVNGPCPGYTFTVTSSDALGNVTSVTDTIPADLISPVIIDCSNIVVSCAGPNGASATYFVLARDNCDPFPSLTCIPPSESFFPIGDTLVHCSARDACGNSNNACSFTVTVTTNCPMTCSSNLLVNGSFEEPGIPDGFVYVPPGSTLINGWEATREGVLWFNPRVAPPSWVQSGVPADGNYMIDMGTNGGIRQAFATIPGKTYKVSFAMGTSWEAFWNGNTTISVTVGGRHLRYFMHTTSPTMVWERHQLSFTASAGSTALEFVCVDGAARYANLDDVRVTDCPVSLASFGGTHYSTLGVASALVSSNQLFVSNFGTQGTAGVRMDVSGMHAAFLTLGDLDTSTLPNGASIMIAAYGDVNTNADSLISSLRATRSGSAIQLSADFTSIGAVAYTALVYDSSNLVAQTFDLTNLVASVTGSMEGSQLSPYTVNPVNDAPSSVIEFPTRPLIAIGGAQPVAGTRVVIHPQGNRISNPPNPIVTPTYTIGWPRWVPWWQPGPYVDPSWRYPGDPPSNEVFIGALTRFEVTGQGAGTLRILEQRAGMFGLEHKAVAGASISGAGTSLLIDNPSLSPAGVDIFAGGDEAWGGGTGNIGFDIRWLQATPQPDPPGFSLPVGASLQATLTGSTDGGTNQILGAIAAVKSGSNSINIQVSMPIVIPEEMLGIWRGSTLVHTGSLPASVTVGYWPSFLEGVVPPPCSGPGCVDPLIAGGFRWTTPIAMTLPNGSNVFGDRISFLAADPIPRPALKLDHASLLIGGGFPGLQIISEHAAPSGQFFSGLSHLAIGPASMSTSSNGFVVTNFGTNNDYGASVVLGSAHFADVSVIGPGSASPDGSEVRVKSYGTLNGVRDQLIGSVIARKAGTNLQFTAGLGPDNLFSGSQVTVHVYDGLNIVSSSLLTSNIVVKVPSIIRDVWEARGWWMFRPGGYQAHIDFGSRRLIALSGQLPMLGTRVVFQACWDCVNPLPQPSLRDAPSLSRMDLVAHGLPSFIISRERLGLLAQAHEAAGLSRLLGLGKELRVHNFISDPDHPDGVSFQLNPTLTNNFGVYWRPIDAFSQMPTGYLRAVARGLLTGTGSVEQVLGTTTITKLGLLKEIFADYLPVFPDSRRVEVLRSNTVVFTTSLTGATGVVARVGDWPLGCGKTTVGPLGPVLCFWWRWWPQAQFEINNQIVLGDEIRILAENAPLPLAHLTQFELRAAGFDELVLTVDDAEHADPITTKAQHFGDILAVSWNPPNLRQALQSADKVTGPWTDVPGATASPYLVQPVNQKEFIRVIQR